MAASTSHIIIVLVGPTCPSCEANDLRLGAPSGALGQGQCADCGTEYRAYQEPESTCPGCGMPHDEQASGAVFCEDCEPSDCLYCGQPTPRGMLSEHHACTVCELGEAA
jgi:hypothetical protein